MLPTEEGASYRCKACDTADLIFMNGGWLCPLCDNVLQGQATWLHRWFRVNPEEADE